MRGDTPEHAIWSVSAIREWNDATSTHTNWCSGNIPVDGIHLPTAGQQICETIGTRQEALALAEWELIAPREHKI